MPSRTHVHPAFHTSLENREMFGWTKPEPVKPTHTLILDGCQQFCFQPDKDHVHFVRKARNGYKGGKWQITGQDVLPIAKARTLYLRLLTQGAIKV